MDRMTPEEKAEINKKLEIINANMTRVLFILNNDSDTNQLGLVGTVKEIEKKVDTLEMKERIFHTKVVTYSSVVATCVGLVFWIGDKIIALIMKS